MFGGGGKGPSSQEAIQKLRETGDANQETGISREKKNHQEPRGMAKRRKHHLVEQTSIAYANLLLPLSKVFLLANRDATSCQHLGCNGMTASQLFWFVSGSSASLTSESIVSCRLSQFSSIAGQVRAFAIWSTVTVSFDMEIF